jgi:hypothetical protein
MAAGKNPILGLLSASSQLRHRLLQSRVQVYELGQEVAPLELGWISFP